MKSTMAHLRTELRRAREALGVEVDKHRETAEVMVRCQAEIGRRDVLLMRCYRVLGLAESAVLSVAEGYRPETLAEIQEARRLVRTREQP